MKEISFMLLNSAR